MGGAEGDVDVGLASGLHRHRLLGPHQPLLDAHEVAARRQGGHTLAALEGGERRVPPASPAPADRDDGFAERRAGLLGLRPHLQHPGIERKLDQGRPLLGGGGDRAGGDAAIARLHDVAAGRHGYVGVCGAAGEDNGGGLSLGMHRPVQHEANGLGLLREERAQVETGRRIGRLASARPRLSAARPAPRPGVSQAWVRARAWATMRLKRQGPGHSDRRSPVAAASSMAALIWSAFCALTKRPPVACGTQAILRGVVGLQGEADDVDGDAGTAQLLGGDADILLAVVGIVVNEQQAALAGRAAAGPWRPRAAPASTARARAG